MVSADVKYHVYLLSRVAAQYKYKMHTGPVHRPTGRRYLCHGDLGVVLDKPVYDIPATTAIIDHAIGLRGFRCCSNVSMFVTMQTTQRI